MSVLDIIPIARSARHLGIFLLIFLVACNSGEQPQPQSNTKTARPSLVLRKFSLPPYSMRLSIGDCKESCPVEVELLLKEQLLDTYTLPVAVANSQTTEETVDAYW